MTNKEHSMLKLLVKKSYKFSVFQEKFLKNQESKIVLSSLAERKYIDFKEETDLLCASELGKIAYMRYSEEKRDSFQKWFNRSFLLGNLSGIITGIIVTLLSAYLLGLLHL